MWRTGLTVPVCHTLLKKVGDFVSFINPIIQKKLCEHCIWRCEAQGTCLFPRCIYRDTGVVQYTGDVKYTIYRDSLSGDRVRVGMKWYKGAKTNKL